MCGLSSTRSLTALQGPSGTQKLDLPHLHLLQGASKHSTSLQEALLCSQHGNLSGKQQSGSRTKKRQHYQRIN
jgi:hypothetical protein